MAIFQAAAQIFSSYAASGKVTDENEHEMILKAIKTSITICRIVEKNVRSDDEIAWWWALYAPLRPSTPYVTVLDYLIFNGR